MSGWGEAIDGNPPSPARPSRQRAVRLKLNTSADCQRALSKIIRDALGDKISTADMARYANAIFTLARLIEGSSLEARIEALEAAGA